MKGCIEELERLKRHHSKDKGEYSTGLVDGFDMAINIIKNKEWYGD